MPRIRDVIGDGHEFSNTQLLVLEILESHPDFVFSTTPGDLMEIRAWAGDPKAPEPPRLPAREGSLNLKAIKNALKTLSKQDRVGSISIHHERYYGTHQAIETARMALASSRTNHRP